MPCSVTLTVSQLPVSTSFFLSALRPLNYAYRARSNNTVGFGSATKPDASPDFWITQEVLPSVPAGAAHVAFPAPSRHAVHQFFAAALKAGGIIHGEPAVRDNKGSYYSAAVIDFDGNSIEAVFRPELSDIQTNVTSGLPSSEDAASFAQRNSANMPHGIASKARSAENAAASLVQSTPSSSKSKPSPAQAPALSGGGDGTGVVATLLGVAAGAALHYAFTHHKDSRSHHMTDVCSATDFVSTPRRQPNRQHVRAPEEACFITLEDNDKDDSYASTIHSRPSRTTASGHGSRHTGQRKPMDATGFDMSGTTIAKSSTISNSEATTTPLLRRPKMLTATAAAPESARSSSLSLLKKTVPPSSSSPSSSTSSASSRSKATRNRSSTAGQVPPPPASTEATTNKSIVTS